MNRTRFIGLAIVLSGLFGTTPAWSLESVGLLKNAGSFDVVSDTPCIVPAGTEKPGSAMDVKGEQIVNCISGKPLSYDLEGDDNVLKIGSVDGRGTKWIVSGKRQTSIQAAEGRFKGWYLDWSVSDDQIVTNGKTRAVRKLILVKEPNKNFFVYPVAP